MEENTYTGHCSICGYFGEFKKNNPSFREGYLCPSCRASLRYRGQASAILKTYAINQHLNLFDLSKTREFSQLSIYEPGVIGPFRTLFSDFKNYKNSFYWEDIECGKSKNDIECQSLEELTFDDDQFDLILSSDIMEHVRKPWVAFSDIFRVLKPGGYHIFSIPVHPPLPTKTQYRVDTTTNEDIHIQKPHYHGNGAGGKSLVYTDFGADITEHLSRIGYEVSLDTIPHEHAEVRQLLTFITQKPQNIILNPKPSIGQYIKRLFHF